MDPKHNDPDIKRKLRERCEYGFQPQRASVVYFRCRTIFSGTVFFVLEEMNYGNTGRGYEHHRGKQ